MVVLQVKPLQPLPDKSSTLERMAGGAAVNTPNTCRRKERMAGGAAVNTPNTCRRKERMAGGAAVNTPNTCRRKERMAGGAAVNTPNTCRRKQRRELFPSSRPDDADWLFPAPPDTLTVYRKGWQVVPR
ncbi:uncharacterized protein LOC135116399 isoform X2 [Scylla paramamosain]|uniref:uncharacterized protein LOC135116399 isoform X2 n=1 Tax=Scylla paramamosain TaxID=85552 RepID=UPI0030835565